MYNETLKFQFLEHVNTSTRFTYLSELFVELEKQKNKYENLVSGGVPTYKIKDNGSVTLISYWPASTKIVRNFIKSRQKENILK